MRRTEDTGNGWQRVYVFCNMCNWQSDLESTTPEIERATRTLGLLKRRAIGEICAHKVVTTQTDRRINRAETELAKLRGELAEKIRRHAENNA